MDTSTECQEWPCTGPKEAGDDLETFRRIAEWESKRFWWSWGQVANLAADRHQWYASVLALCASTRRIK